MSVSHALATSVDEIMESSVLAPRINGFHLEPRCRICRNDSVRRKVNDLLATGAGYAMVLRALGEDNAKLDKRGRVTIDSIRNHCQRHFPVQHVARASYREILVRRQPPRNGNQSRDHRSDHPPAQNARRPDLRSARPEG